jgi:hypothetical protein
MHGMVTEEEQKREREILKRFLKERGLSIREFDAWKKKKRGE